MKQTWENLLARSGGVLATQVFDLRAHVGRLLVLIQDEKFDGYLDSFMRWLLINRTGEETEALILTADQSRVASRWMYVESQEYMNYSSDVSSWRQYVV